MNCDDAFEYITDPNRQQATELNWHLDMCPRCRRMKETLEPALSLLTAECSVTTGDANRLQHARIGRLFAGDDVGFESRRLAETTAMARRIRQPTAARSDSSWRRRIAVAIVGSALFACMLLMISPGGDRDAGISPEIEMCLWQTREAAVENSPRAVLATCLSCHPASR
ncbi:MAG: hypothetical protein O3A00_19305 [Planctomycetota bacterium]|nr:hypothetical protein [Planctomycetota bacterium]